MTECPECGARNSENSSFCIRCGSQFAAASGVAPAPRAGRSDPSEVLDEAAKLYAEGQLDDAADACHAALNNNPDLVAARSLLGMVEEDRGNHSAALAEYEAVLRLSPERTAERQRADRLRALVRTSAAAALDEDSETRPTRWVPILVAAAVGLVVLLIGGLWVASLSNPRPENQPRSAQQPGSEASAPMTPTPEPGVSGGKTLSLSPGTSGSIGRTIGPRTEDQSAVQPANRTRRSSGSSGRSTPLTDPLPLPPPTVSASDRNPITIPQSYPVQPQPSTTWTPEPTPPLAQPRGKVRIWVGDDAPATTSGRSSGNGDSAPSGYEGSTRAADGRMVAPGSRSTDARTLAPAPRGSRASAGSSANQPVHTGARSVASSSSRPSGPGGPAPASQDTRTVSTGRTTETASPMVVSRDPRNDPGAGGLRPYGSAAARTAPATRSGSNETSASSASSGTQASASASGLRSQAQQARSTGRLSDARQLYQAAIQGYRADAARNPGRAASNRSAIESCQRALEAIDASQ